MGAQVGLAMESWIAKDPIKLGLFRGRIPSLPGTRIVLFRRGVPVKVLPKGVAEANIDYLSRVLCDGSVAVNESCRAEFFFDSFLTTKDAVQVTTRIAVFLKSKQDDNSLIRIAASADRIVQILREECLVLLQRKIRTIDYDALFGMVSEVEADLLVENGMVASADNRPYDVENIAVLAIDSKAAGILSSREYEQIRRSEERAKRLALEIGDLEFNLKKQHVETDQTLKNLPLREKIKLEKERVTARNDTIRQISEIRKQFGNSSLPTSVQQAIILAGIQAKIAAAAGNMELANNIMQIAVNAVGVDREKALELLKGTLSVGRLTVNSDGRTDGPDRDLGRGDVSDADFEEMDFEEVLDADAEGGEDSRET